MARMPQPGSILQHADPWGREISHLRRELPALFAAVIKFLSQFAIEKDDCLSDGDTIFRSAKTENIDAGFPTDFFWRDAQGRYGIGKSRAIDVNAQLKMSREICQRLQFLKGIERSHFGRLRQT